MSEQKKSFKEKQKLAEDFIEKTNPYSPPKSINIDLRKYIKFLHDNGLKRNEVTKEQMKQFQM